MNGLTISVYLTVLEKWEGSSPFRTM